MAKPECVSVILIRKYNDRLVEKPVMGYGSGKREGRWKRVVFRWRSLRTQVAAHLLRADSNCFPYLRVPLRHCSPPPVWLAASSGCNVYVNAYTTCTCLLCTQPKAKERERERERGRERVRGREEEWSYVSGIPTLSIDCILSVHTVMLLWHWYRLTLKL